MPNRAIKDGEQTCHWALSGNHWSANELYHFSSVFFLLATVMVFFFALFFLGVAPSGPLQRTAQSALPFFPF